MGGKSPADSIPLWTLWWTYFNYSMGILFGYFNYLVLVLRDKYSSNPPNYGDVKEGYSPLIYRKEYFYTRFFFARIADCWHRPICGAPAGITPLMERKVPSQCAINKPLIYTGKEQKCINLGSYNYLGFAETEGPCIDDTIAAVKKYGVGTTSTRMEVGTMDVHRTLEKKIAQFVGKEDSLIFDMGYATNSTTIPALVGKKGLIISDSLNHASIVTGCRASGARIKVFKHNDPKDLERVIRESIADGQPRTHRDWQKILIIVEGVYSMEGEILRLAEIVEIKKKYKCYLYVDEAHSIGALGAHARGVCEICGVNPKDVDILMGTFTKSFGSVGGYIAGDKDLIRYLRQSSFGSVYTCSIPIPCAQHVLSVLHILTGEDGTDDGQKRIVTLRENSNFFRSGLRKLGFRVIGDTDSPVIPIMIFHPAKIGAFSRECLLKGIAVVVVSFPATGLLASRARFCISASHTRESLEKALKDISEIGDLLMLKYGDIPQEEPVRPRPASEKK